MTGLPGHGLNNHLNNRLRNGLRNRLILTFRGTFLRAAALMLTALTLVFVAACSESRSKERVITVSIMPQKMLLERLVGDKYKVHSLLNASGDPETYDPSMSHLINVDNSEAFFRMGHIGFEEAIASRILTSCPDLKIVDTSRGLSLVRGTHGDAHEADPHVWASVPNARIIAQNMHAALLEMDPANASFYTANLLSLNEHLDSVERELQQLLKPLRGEAFVVWHPSLSYFARDYGLRQIALSSEHKDASVKQTRERMALAAQSGAKVMLLDRESSRNGLLAARELGLATGDADFNTLDYDWEGELLRIARTLSLGAKGQLPAAGEGAR